jgi:hypothetical protein
MRTGFPHPPTTGLGTNLAGDAAAFAEASRL